MNIQVEKGTLDYVKEQLKDANANPTIIHTGGVFQVVGFDGSTICKFPSASDYEELGYTECLVDDKIVMLANAEESQREEGYRLDWGLFGQLTPKAKQYVENWVYQRAQELVKWFEEN